MSSITKRVTASGVVYDVRYRDPSRKERKKTFVKRSDAARYGTTIDADLLRGQYIDPHAGRATLRAYVEDRWLPTRIAQRPGTLDTYRSHLRTHILPAFGDRPLGSLRRPDMKGFVASLTHVLAPSTVCSVFATLSAVMASAVDDERIGANPCARVELPRVEARVIAPLEPQAVLALAAAITPRYAVTVWLAAGAGLREGEVLGLMLPRVDFLRRRLHIEEQMQGSNGKAPEYSPLKTRASRRVVPVDDVVLSNRGTRRCVVSRRDRAARHEPARGAVRRSSFGYCWRKAVEAAGLPTGTRYHDLRHFYASTLIAANMHPKSIQSRLGHATIAETMDTYGHLFPDAEDHGRGAVDAMLRMKIPADVPSVCHDGTA